MTEILNQIGLPWAYHHYAEGESPDPPFLLYLYPESNNFGANNGYSGTLTIVRVPEAFAEQILKQIKDVNGALVEDANATGAEFAMAFEFEGDVNKKRHIFYRCTAGRPEVSSKTKEENIEPNTQELSINCIPRLDNHFVKATIEDASSSAYSGWYGTAPYEPTLTATPVVAPEETEPEGE